MSYHEALEARVFDATSGAVTDYGAELATHLDVTTDALSGAITNINPGLDMQVSAAGWPGWLLIVLMGVTMFVTQRQLMARNTSADPQQQQTQKIMMYVMPVFLAFISFNLPLGVLVYWVTTNLWQVVQQQVVLREASHPAHAHKDAAGPAPRSGKGRKISDSTPTVTGNGDARSRQASRKRPPAADSKHGGSGAAPAPRRKPKKDHLPRRPGS
jgi:membrane protein insertase Oxa1/YidC/SpoIIIJ